MVRDPLPHLATDDNLMVTLPIMADDLFFVSQILDLVVAHGDPATTRLVLAPDDRARAMAVSSGMSHVIGGAGVVIDPH